MSPSPSAPSSTPAKAEAAPCASTSASTNRKPSRKASAASASPTPPSSPTTAMSSAARCFSSPSNQICRGEPWLARFSPQRTLRQHRGSQSFSILYGRAGGSPMFHHSSHREIILSENQGSRRQFRT
ncbi:MAG: hypothetical protein F4X87_12335 [Chloroflexi bacterium]|nr:hypothetical protein [Chloroflexota bacterium]